MTPTLILVGADKGGVGKTTTTRVLLDYCKDRDLRPSVFDSEGALHSFYPYAKIVDIDAVSGQMQIFDGVATTDLTIVDMKAGVLSATLRAMRNAGLLTKIDQGNVRLMILHVLGSDTQSMGEIAATNALLEKGAEHILVENHASDGHFFKWDVQTRKLLVESIKPEGHIEIPHLDAMASEDVDLRKMSFAGYIKNAGEKKHSDYLTRVVRHWRDQVYKSFDSLGLVAKA